MTQFDQEMKTFKEIIPKYRPINGYHLVLDLADYKSGKETICRYRIGSKKYRNYINVECHDKNIDIVMITSNKCNQITNRSKYLYAVFCYDQKVFTEIEDLSPSIKLFNRTIRQETELLFFELNNPQPIKPFC
ncbi:MAG: hypothetical protein AABY53_03585 [Bdellovibrionota bacterium]